MKIPQICLLFSVLSGALLFTGCTSYQIGNTQTRDINQYANSVNIQGVSAAADLYATEAKTKEGFYVNLTERDYYPVQLVIQNDGADTILLLKSDIAISDASGNEYKPVNAAVMVDEFEHNKMAYALLGFGIFSYMSADDANKKMAADWHSKELNDETIINTSRKNSGFVYFKMPKGMKPNGMTLKLKLEDLQTKAKLDFKVRM